MLDGVIAAFHGDPVPDPVAVDRLAAHLVQSCEAVQASLLAEVPPLGYRRLLWAYRNGVQWNPADDLCVACSVEIDDELAPNTFESDLVPSVGLTEIRMVIIGWKGTVSGSSEQGTNHPRNEKRSIKSGW